MRESIVRYGQVKTVGIITFVSILASLLVSIPLGLVIDGRLHTVNLIISVIVPLIVAPIISWYIIKLVFKIHHLEIKMRDIATYDSLTKVMTRRAFITNAEALHQLIKREKQSLVMLYIDIDNFKQINDTHGHSIGDEVLKALGITLSKSKRESDIVGRLGGEEFAFLLPGTNAQGAKQFSENLRKTIKNQCLVFGRIKIQYTISIGVSVFDHTNEVDLDELTTQSDKALYLAKNSGKNCIQLFENQKAVS